MRMLSTRGTATIAGEELDELRAELSEMAIYADDPADIPTVQRFLSRAIQRVERWRSTASDSEVPE